MSDENSSPVKRVYELSESDRARIRAEEVFREEIRTSLGESSPGTVSRIWDALNSSFVLFLLSSVLLSAISWQYQGWSEQQQRESDVARLKADSSTELGYRFFLMLAALGNEKFTGQDARYIHAVFFGKEPYAAGVSRFTSISVPAIMFLLRSEHAAEADDQFLARIMPRLSVAIERFAAKPEVELIETKEREEIRQTLRKVKLSRLNGNQYN